MSFHTKKKTTNEDGSGANLGPILSTPSSAPGAAGSLREETEVRLELQPEPRSLSVQPKGRIRKHTPRSSKIKRQVGLKETSSLNAAISSSSSGSPSNSP